MAITRLGLDHTNSYLQRVKQENFEAPTDDSTLRTIATYIDRSCERVYQVAHRKLQESPLFQVGLATLNRREKPTCGGFTEAHAILSERTSYEQMAIITEWVRTTPLRVKQTLTLINSDYMIIPVAAMPINTKKEKKPCTLMTIQLGSGSRGKLKAPKYETWAQNGHDPLSSPQDKPFIDPLNALEIERRPDCIGSILLKANPYERGTLPNTWRYKVTTNDARAQEASAELKKQNDPSVRWHCKQSAGFNLAKMIADENLRESNILPDCLYEEYADENYKDDNTPSVTPLEILRSLPIGKDNSNDLDALMQKLFITRIGISSIPTVKDYVATTLFSSRE